MQYVGPIIYVQPSLLTGSLVLRFIVRTVLQITFTPFLFSTTAVALLLLFQCSTICDDKKTDAVPFLSAKVVRGLWLSKGRCHLVCLENLHTCVHFGSYFPPKPCVSLPRYLYFATKRNQHTPIFGRIKKMSLWISKR